MTTKTELMKIIRSKCLDCATTEHEVRHCSSGNCPLWDYRLGKDPSPNPRKAAAARRILHGDRSA